MPANGSWAAPTSPLVVCAVPYEGQGTHQGVAEPGFATFFTSFFAR